MKKKISLGTTITLIILTAALTISVTMLIAMRYFNKQVSSVTQRQAMYEHINDVDKKIREYYTDLSEETLRQEVIRGYVAGIGDPYAAYFTADEYTAESLRLSGSVNNVGIYVCADTAGSMVISFVDAESAADKAGVQAGDIITAIEGFDMTGKAAGDIQYVLDHSEKVLLSVSREGNTLAYELSPYAHTVRSVQEKLIGTVGYLKITAFYDNTPDQFKAALSSLTDQGATSFVFDLRGNRGGQQAAMADMLSYLMPIGAYGAVTDSDGVLTKLSATASYKLNVSTATLVNADTAGEAEFFAGVLQEYSLTTVVGVTSAGEAKYQQYFTLEADSSAVKLSVGEYSLLKGGSWEGIGIVPGLEVKLNEEQLATFPLLKTESDLQVQAALSAVSTGDAVGSLNNAK